MDAIYLFESERVNIALNMLSAVWQSMWKYGNDWIKVPSWEVLPTEKYILKIKMHANSALGNEMNRALGHVCAHIG